MPVQIPHFQRISPEEANPVLAGFASSQDMMARALANQKSRAQLPFVPLNSVADAASKIAYSQLMGPQFIAKLLGNPDVVANMKNPGQLTDLVTNAGTTQSNLFNTLLSSALGGDDNSRMPEQNYMQNPMMNQPSNSPIWDSRQTGNSIPRQSKARTTNYSNDMGIMDGDTSMINGIPVTTQGTIESNDSPNEYGGKAGSYRGLIEQGKKSGEIRANTLKEWGDEYSSSLRLQDSLDSLSKIATDPVFSNMRNKIPFFQDKQLKLLSKIGTPEEQEKIGMFVDDAGRVLQNTYNAWSGKGLKGEFDATKEFKINENDTINTLVGKLISAQKLAAFNQQRLEFASEFVRTKGMDPQEALQKADKMLNRKKIISDIDATLHPKPNDDDIKYMMEKYNLPKEEVMSRLKKKGII
jgi:hypothetical protein